MNEIFFLLFAFLTIFLSIKLSYYADTLSKTTKISSAVVGGIILAGVTSLPEFVTCFSSVLVGNSTLAIGDILGSNLFNIFMICFFDVIFMKKMIFTKTLIFHNLVIFLLIFNSFFLLLFFLGVLNYSFFSIGIPTFVIIVTYFIYIRKIPSIDDNEILGFVNSSFIVFKFIITAVLIILSSILLTVVVDNLSNIYNCFSSGFLGAVFLGVTTSLPEVITFYTLVSINNYDLALSNILGSNFFNLLILAFSDLLFSGYPIYTFFDIDIVNICLLGILFLIFCLISNFRKQTKTFFSYIFFSLMVTIIYLFFWISNFVF